MVSDDKIAQVNDIPVVDVAKALGIEVGLLPEIWSSFSESIIDKFSMLLTLNLGGYTYAEALQWATDCG
jgi:hypothetical protein